MWRLIVTYKVVHSTFVIDLYVLCVRTLPIFVTGHNGILQQLESSILNITFILLFVMGELASSVR